MNTVNFLGNILKFVLIVIVFIFAPISFLWVFCRANWRIKKDSKEENNSLKNLDGYFEEVTKEIKDSSRLDFFDWVNLNLFILGIGTLFVIKYFVKPDILPDFATAIVLWLTCVVILQYTKETYHLKQIETKHLDLQRKNSAPFVIIHFEKPDCFVLKNVGGGVARNVSWKLIEKRGAFPLEECIEYPMKTVIEARGSLTNYTKINKSIYSDLEPSETDCHEVKINYEDMDGTKYITELESGVVGDDYKVLDYKIVK